MKKKIVFITTTPFTAKVFLLDFFYHLKNEYEIYLISNFSGNPEHKINLSFVKEIDIKIERGISPLSDIGSIWALLSFFRANDVDIVHTVTPKAGLVGMISSRVANIDKRYHTFTGQVWVDYIGVKRKLFIFIDKLISFLSTNILIDSLSQKEFLIKNNIVDSDATVLGKGSISGVDIKKFTSNIESRRLIRKKYKIKNNEVVFLFLGRINRDKGVLDLIDAFKRLKGEGYSRAKLFIVGPDEENIIEGIVQDDMTKIGYTLKPQEFMGMADVFCLPSYREGFGTVIIESAACGVMSIGSNIYGLSDAIIDGETGLLHDVRSVSSIYQCMVNMIEDDKERHRLSLNAKNRAVTDFNKKFLSECLLDFYNKG